MIFVKKKVKLKLILAKLIIKYNKKKKYFNIII